MPVSPLSPDTEDALRRAGVEITSLAEEDSNDPTLAQRLYEFACAALGDVPRMGEYVPPSFEQFVKFNLKCPGLLPEGFFLAREGSRFVGMSNLELVEGDPTTVHQVFTATLREYRGRGIATQLKLRTIAFARERGFRYIRTMNDSLNTRIWSINGRLGFQREKEMVWTERDLRQPYR
ncbi:MAG: GNAT family N-acetyltransferase [Thermoplasmata archaeon]|nr:GNAT family N-acetyltransferase [Thermoplasmata archaeon]